MGSLAIAASFGLFLCSYVFFVLGQLYPVFNLNSTFSGGNFFVKGQRSTLSATVSELWEEQHYFPVVLVIAFSFVVPIFKFCVGCFALLQAPLIRYVRRVGLSRVCPGSQQLVSLKALQENEAFTPIESFLVTCLIKFKPVDLLRKISKYQMADTFMSLILIASMESDLVTITILPGGYYFWAYCILSLTATQFLSLSLSSLHSPKVIPEVSSASNTFSRSAMSLSPSHNVLSPSASSHQDDLLKDKLISQAFLSNAEKRTHFFSPFAENASLPKTVLNFRISMIMKPLKRQFISTFSSFSIIFIFMFVSIAIFFIFKSMSISIAIVNKDIDIWRITLSGIDILKHLRDSPYFFNGLLTYLVFPLLLPTIQAVLFMGILITVLICSYRQYHAFVRKAIENEDATSQLTSSAYVPSSFLTRVSYANNDTTTPLSVHNPFFLFTPTESMGVTARNSPKELSTFESCFLRTLEKKPFLAKSITFSTYLVDWCMADVFCLGLISAYFSVNAMSVLKFSTPFPNPPYSGFWFVYAYGICSFLLGTASNTLASYMDTLKLRHLIHTCSSSTAAMPFYTSPTLHFPESSTSFFYIRNECFCDPVLILPPMSETFFDFTGNSSLLHAHARDTLQRGTSELISPITLPVTKPTKNLPFPKSMTRIFTVLGIVLIASVLFLTRHFKREPFKFQITKVNKDLEQFKLFLNEETPSALPFVISGNCSNIPHPCMLVKRDPLFVYNFSETTVVTVNWILGLNTLTIRNISYSVLPNKRVSLFIDLIWDDIFVDLLIQNCPKHNQACTTLLNSSSACCGDNIKVMLSVSAQCTNSVKTSDPFSALKVDKIIISPINVSYSIFTINISTILEEKGKSMINTSLNNSLPFIFWEGKKRTIAGVINNIAKLNSPDGTLRCPLPPKENELRLL